ncbi:Peritrophin-48 [Orchesella cincta]|uniref:Peritrophin-48 n=1 Tax=Orchesella cincta TaxID=48709 RepID=A0A1D2N0L0_ORCCI|nr:Peritrophin-48 [Orchesella cincta]
MDNDGLRTDLCDNSSTVLSVFNYCQNFAECHKGIAIVRSCHERDVFSPIKRKCVEPKEFECKLKCTKRHNSVFMDPFDPNLYYACLGGELETFECDPGVKFILDKQQCNNTIVYNPTNTTSKPH